MIAKAPAWTFGSPHKLKRQAGRVWLLPDRVLGTWFLLDRETGRLIYDRSWWMGPNYIEDVAEGIAVCGRWEEKGVWGVEAETGRLLWTSHEAGLWGRFLRLWDWVPFFDSGLKDSPFRILSGEVHTWSGRILDLRTGRDLRRRDPPLAKEGRGLMQQLYFDEAPAYPDGSRLRHGPLPGFRTDSPGMDRLHSPWRLYREASDGGTVWSLDLQVEGIQINGNYYSYRWAEPFVYLLISDKEPYNYETRDGVRLASARAVDYTVWTVDAATGQVLQKVPVGPDPLENCEVESLDDKGLLLSGRDPAKSRHVLLHFPRQARI